MRSVLLGLVCLGLSATAADQTRIQRRLRALRRFRSDVGILAEGLRTQLRIHREPVEKEVLQFVVFEIGGPQTRPLLEDRDRESGLRQFARHDAAGGSRTDHHEIHRFVGFELARQERFSVGELEYGTNPVYSRS